MSALDGLRVLDFSTGIAGPTVGMLLGDHGADVIRIDGMFADPQADSPGYAVWNRNKRSVLLNPDAERDVRWLASAVSGADVAILGDGASLDDWGRDVAAAAQRNGSLITLRLPKYVEGLDGWRGGESQTLLAAVGGTATRQSSYAGGPIASMSPYVLYIQGVWATASLLAALVERTVSGRGQEVEVSGMQGVLETSMSQLNTAPGAPDVDTTIGATGRHPTYRHFLCADGLWMAVGALGPKFETRLLEALGLHSVLNDPRIDGATSQMALPENLPWVKELVEAAFRARPRRELLELVEGLGIPCGPMQSREEWFDSEQIRAIGMRAAIDDPHRGRVEMPGIPLVLTRTPGAIRRHAPVPGEHNGIDPWPAKPASEASVPRYVPGPLHGFTIINMGTFVASPYAGMLLSELGATVVKVEPITGDPFRVSGYPYNRGMRSVSVDLASERGQAVFHRLVADVDIVMDAMRPGVMAKLNLDYERLSAINPRLVTQSLSGYGDTGPLASRPGVDMVIQAESGMMSSWGGDDVPVANTYAINDVATAAMSVLVSLLGLYERQLSGMGQRTWNSLAGTSVYLQMEEVVRFAGRPAPARGGRDFRGPDALQRYYEVVDGWLGVDVPPRDRAAAADRLRDENLVSGDDLGHELESSLGGLELSEALDALARAGVPAAATRRVSEVLTDPALLKAEMFHVRVTDDGIGFAQTGKYATFSRTQRSGPMIPPGNGEHTRSVLLATGFSGPEIDELVESGVVHSGVPIEHLLPISYR
ncbi:putative formyl-CoA transferase [Microbacterium sp. HM58-2]|nr:putative formyl-CoA transferase [Microbacterium sp. HM58-2]